MKNMASIAAIRRAIEYETARHIDAIENGTEELVQETRGWNDDAGKSFAMRNKETAGDYRYFPDPNIMPVVIDDEWYDQIRASLPELPEVKLERYVSQVGLSDYDAGILAQSRAFCDCFEGAMAVGAAPKEAANWIITNCTGILNKRGLTSEDLPVPGRALGQLIGLVNDGKVSSANGKRLLEALFDLDSRGESVPEDMAAFAEAEGLVNSSDTGALEAVVAAVIAADPETAQAYRDGREKALNPLFGACMKQLKGKCDTQVLRQLLIAELNK
jgi:aspartyl-tRNA(Asn)/glutamyl-tRNA(Gln) amidotransferase subunit B